MKKPAGGPPATAKTVAKPAHHAHMTKAQHQRAKAAAAKAARTRKHHAAAAAKHKHAGKHSKKVGLANVEGGLACCAAEALAMSLRLAGWPVSDEQVVNLYRLTAGAEDVEGGASIKESLEWVARYGLAGHALESCREILGERHEAARAPDGGLPGAGREEHLARLAAPGRVVSHGLILGAELPGPHALLVAPDGGWWSWGEPFDPADWPGLVVEEAWALSWQ